MTNVKRERSKERGTNRGRAGRDGGEEEVRRREDRR